MRVPFESETTHEGRLLTVKVLTFETPGGETVRREVVHHPGAVAIVPVRTDGFVILIRNHRVAVGERLWEIPAGTREPGEDPEVTAARELEEETGYRAERLWRLGGFYTSPGCLDERLDLYVAEGLVATSQNLDAGEQIEVAPRPASEVLAMIDDGRIQDGKTIAGILMWDRRRRGPGPGAGMGMGPGAGPGPAEAGS